MTTADTAPPGDTPGGVDPVLEVLTKRADFLRAARARRASGAAFTLQARWRAADEADPALIRVGFTCSKKVGNAVARNRAKRRLREIARLVMPGRVHADHDYVLIGRAEKTADRPFDLLQDDLRKALAVVHGGRE